MAKDNGKSFFRFYIYIDWQKIMENHFEKLYIYNVAKRCGKSSEDHIHNYRQL